jgi:SAM-dependent methyltransferase
MIKNKTVQLKPSKAWVHLTNTWGKLITPPAKPCRDQLKIWDEAIKKYFYRKQNLQALIFGATPELRNLALKNGFKVTVCDINPSMIKAMNQYVSPILHKREKVVIGNWLNTDLLPKKHFDLIMGDCILNQMPGLKKFQQFIKHISSLLKPNGIFLFREVVRLAKEPVIKTDENWLKWLKTKKTEHTDLYMMFKYQSNTSICRRSPFLCYSLSVFNKIAYLHRRGKCPDKFWQWLNAALGKYSKPVLVFVRKDLEKNLKHNFVLKQIKQCRQYKHCKYMPLYLAKPR